jgi:hypothetical protein
MSSIWTPTLNPAPDGMLTLPQQRKKQVAVTLTPDLITDSIRQASINGDGLSPQSKIGIWKAATNLVTNGGFETNTTGYNNVSIASLTRITTQQKFGVACGEVVTSNLVANEGAYHNFTATVAAYSVSAFVRGSGGGTVRMAVRDNGGASAQTGSAVTLTSSWQRITLVTTNLTAATWRCYVETNAQQSITFQIDGVQAEIANSFGTVLKASPYVETDGGTATRTAGTITIPKMNTYCTPTQGWMAIRFIPRYSAASDPSAFTMFTWGDDGTHRLLGESRFDIDSLRFERANGSAGARTVGASYSADASATFICRWTATVIGCSLQGLAFSDSANTLIPSLASTSLVIGASQFADLCWILIGSGTLVDADATTIHGYGVTIGNTPPTAFPGTCKFAWQALNTKALVSN